MVTEPLTAAVRCSTDLVQLMDAFLHAADGGHGPQGVGVQLPEAVLPADLEEGHHRAFLPATEHRSKVRRHQETSSKTCYPSGNIPPPQSGFHACLSLICSISSIPQCKNLVFVFQGPAPVFGSKPPNYTPDVIPALVLEHMIVQE